MDMIESITDELVDKFDCGNVTIALLNNLTSIDLIAYVGRRLIQLNRLDVLKLFFDKYPSIMWTTKMVAAVVECTSVNGLLPNWLFNSSLNGKFTDADFSWRVNEQHLQRLSTLGYDITNVKNRRSVVRNKLIYRFNGDDDSDIRTLKEYASQGGFRGVVSITRLHGIERGYWPMDDLTDDMIIAYLQSWFIRSMHQMNPSYVMPIFVLYLKIFKPNPPTGYQRLMWLKIIRESSPTKYLEVILLKLYMIRINWFNKKEIFGKSELSYWFCQSQ